MRTFITIIMASLCAKADVRPHMDQMLQEIFNLKPFIVSEEGYRDPKNAPLIEKSLQNMVALSEKISHEGKIRESGFAVSSQAMTKQLKEAEIVYRVGSKDYSLWMLRSTLGTCMSCHTQLPSSSTKFEFMNKEKFLTRPFDEAEFLFIVRNFDKASPVYEDLLSTYPQKDSSVEHVEQALSRLTYYYVRVKRDLDGFLLVLNKGLKNEKLPNFLKERMQGLQAATKNIKSQPYPEFTEKQAQELRRFVEKNLKKELAGDFDLTPERDISYLRISSVLYKYLDQYPQTKLKPEILYWLSFCERRYQEKAFYSLPELYLKQCLQEYPKSKIAPSCLKEYTQLIEIAYTGSSGTHIPSDIEKELEDFRRQILGVKTKPRSGP